MYLIEVTGPVGGASLIGGIVNKGTTLLCLRRTAISDSIYVVRGSKNKSNVWENDSSIRQLYGPQENLQMHGKITGMVILKILRNRS
jgi:hypothetical protein